MFKKFLKSFLDSNEKAVSTARPIIAKVRSLEDEIKRLSDEDIKLRVEKMRKDLSLLVNKIPQEKKVSLQIINREEGLSQQEKDIQNKLMEFAPELFALINEVYRRKIGITYFDVQLLAGTVLSQGQKLTELKTGEGKTMVFQLPAFLYALTGRGSHVITVNDYLAKVGGEYAGHIAESIGLTVGIIASQSSYKYISDEMVKKIKGEEVYKEMKEFYKNNRGLQLSNMRGYNLVECDKKDAYTCDIVYGTNNEFGFDYLRDNMTRSLGEIKQSELYFAIIDEADSILIDEARTPLIISAPAEASNDLYAKFAQAVRRLTAEQDYTVDEKAHSAVLTETGISKMEKMLAVKNIWEDYLLAHHLDNALKAMALYKKDKDYLIKDGEIMIVDEFTGRVLQGRRYSEGLHQAIEAKEGVEIKKESKTLATITFQNFFRLYKVICGGSGTVLTEAEEFYKIYKLDSVEIPTNKPIVRKDHTDRVYKNRKAKFMAVAREIQEAHQKGQPVLVGTTSIEDSEYLSEIVDRMGIEHEVLNAKHHEREALIVAKAGRKGAVTIATNMAGRGTDIPLEPGVQELGGLYVIGTQRHEARRIDNQLRGRSGRQGDPGQSRFFISLDDDIMRIQGGGIVQRLMEMTNIPDEMPIEAKLIGRSIENAQKRMENMHFDSRKRVVEYDDVMNQQREIFYVRRHNIQELSDNSQGRFLKYPQIVTKPINDPMVRNARETLEKQVQEQLFDEVNFIVNKHFIEGREDKVDTQKLINDFLDFALDEKIADALVVLRKAEKVEKTKVGEFLGNELNGKSLNEITEYLEAIVRQLHTLKQQELKDSYYEVVKMLMLENMDNLWTEHLETMQDLREGIGLRGYAQRDPLVEYKNESFRLFEDFITRINSETSRRLLKVSANVVRNITASQPEEIRTNEGDIADVLEGSREILTSVSNMLKKKSESTKQKSTTVKNSPKKNIGRNDPCWCGSGKKYKKCHGK